MIDTAGALNQTFAQMGGNLMKSVMFAALALLMAAPLSAQDDPEQDLSGQEVVVTASRIEQDDYIRDMPAVGLRRAADFLVQEVVIRGDTRDQAQRRREIRAMLADAIRRADAAGVELAFGDFVLTRLTSANVEEITLSGDGRPDSEQVRFLVKARLAGTQTGEAAERQIARFVDAVPEVGRAQMDVVGDSTLSIVSPDNYRPQIAEEIGRDARAMAQRIGDGYAVQVEGLNMPVQWARSGPGEVLLFVPYRLTITPRPAQ